MTKPKYCVRKENHCYGCEYSYEPDLFDSGCMREGKSEEEITAIVSELNKQPKRFAAISQGREKAIKLQARQQHHNDTAT